MIKYTGEVESVMREWNPVPKEGRSFTCVQRPESKSLPQLGIVAHALSIREAEAGGSL